MNTVAYVLRLCCRGAEAARLPALGKAAASHQGCREHPAERPAWGTDPLAAHPEVTRAKKGLELGYPTATALPCASPQIRFPPGPLQAGDSRGAPALHPMEGGHAWRAPVPRQHGPGGNVYQNSEVGAITSWSSFLWERKGARRCVNKQPLPQVAPHEGRGRLDWGSPISVPPSWDGGDSPPLGIIPREHVVFPDRHFNQPNSA